MDDPGLDPESHRSALAGLARVNRLSGTSRRLWSAIERECESPSRGLQILEIGSGGGDVLVDMARRHPAYTFHGMDISAVAVECARRRAASLANIQFFTGDVLADSPTGSYDVVFCSLFLHHFDEVDVVKILKKCRLAARQIVLAEDLSRTRAGYALAWFGGRILSRSPVVHHDAPASVAGAFTPSEARVLARGAGLVRIEIAAHWPERFLLIARPA
jgi:2-polyprenyl-3-methyl-5-hydroxy-6-metoxy-1,4-benzoquinol methylase